jgi:GABA permease
VSHVRLRRKLERENPQALTLKMWAFPYLTYLTIAAMVLILVSMLFMESMRSQLYLTMLITALVVASYFLFKRKSAALAHEAGETEVEHQNQNAS